MCLTSCFRNSAVTAFDRRDFWMVLSLVRTLSSCYQEWPVRLSRRGSFRSYIGPCVSYFQSLPISTSCNSVTWRRQTWLFSWLRGRRQRQEQYMWRGEVIVVSQGSPSRLRRTGVSQSSRRRFRLFSFQLRIDMGFTILWLSAVKVLSVADSTAGRGVFI